jgi:Na+-driven multidrug efflux pump
MKLNQFVFMAVAAIALSSQPVLAQPAGAEAAGGAAAGTVTSVGLAVGIAAAVIVIAGVSGKSSTGTTGTK